MKTTLHAPPSTSMLRQLSLLFLLACLGYSCQSPPVHSTTKESKPIPPTANHDRLLTKGLAVLTALQQKNVAALQSHISPTKGLLFSPYGYIDTLTAVRMDTPALRSLLQKGEKIQWGYYDGSGERIALTWEAYYKKFIYDADFLNAEKTEVNEYIGTGNSLKNIQQIFPQSDFIEYHFSGFNPVYQGMDWSSLRLVFEVEKGHYFLVAIVHDQWTS